MDQEIKEKILKKSISLENYGINNFAWDKDTALSLINNLMEDSIGIFGGDVYKLHKRSLEVLSDNWYCEPAENEPKEAFFLRSKIQAISYIEAYPESSKKEEFIFSITFTEKFC